MKSPIFIALLLMRIWQRDALCAVSDKGTESRQKAAERANVTFTLPPQAGNADGTVSWSDLLEMTLERPGQAKKTVHLKKKITHSLGALLKFAKEGESFMSYSDEGGNQLVCRVKSNYQTGPQTSRCVGLVELDGNPCTFIGGVALCSDGPEEPATIDVIGEVPPTRKKRSEDLKATGVEVLVERAIRRAKRQASKVQYRMELCFTADETVYDMFANHIDLISGTTAEEETKQYIVAIANGIHDLFQTIDSQTMSINVAVLAMNVAQTSGAAPWAEPNAENVLNYNIAFPQLETDAWTLFPDRPKCDAIVGLTRKDLSSTESSSPGVIGAARTGGMCDIDYSRSICEVDFRVVYALTHEMGHLLNASHDSTPCETPAKVMNSFMGAPDEDREYYGWSTCSIATFETFVTAPEAICLVQNHIPDPQLNTDRCTGFLGELLNTPEQMCQMLYGTNYGLCSGSATGSNICSYWVWCKLNRQGSCSRNYLLTNGYPCEAGTDKRCYQGYCTLNYPADCTTTTTTTTTTTAGPTTQSSACSTCCASSNPCKCHKGGNAKCATACPGC